MKKTFTSITTLALGLLFFVSGCSKESEQVTPLRATYTAGLTDAEEDLFALVQNGNGSLHHVVDYQWQISTYLLGLDVTTYFNPSAAAAQYGGYTLPLTLTKYVVTKAGNRSLTWKGNLLQMGLGFSAPTTEVIHNDTWSDGVRTWTSTCVTDVLGNITLTSTYKAK